MTCRTCRHPERQAIDRALAGGASVRDIARQYGLTRSGVSYHEQKHVAKAVEAQLEKREREDASIVGHLLMLRDAALKILQNASDERTALQAIRETRGVLETMGQASGELLPTQVQQVYISLGVRDEGELRRILEDHRRLRAASGDEALDDAEADAIAALRLVLAERPERADAIRAALFDASGAEVVE